MYQTKNLINRRLNQSKKLLLLRARPKVLLTQNYETAKLFFNRYRDNILGIISDVEFLKNKKKTKSNQAKKKIKYLLKIWVLIFYIKNHQPS